MGELSNPFASNGNAPNVSTPSGLNAITAAGRFFFNKISIGTLDTRSGIDDPGTGRICEMINCMITNVTHDNLNYSDSSPITWTVQFQPEHIEFKNF